MIFHLKSMKQAGMKIRLPSLCALVAKAKQFCDAAQKCCLTQCKAALRGNQHAEHTICICRALGRARTSPCANHGGFICVGMALEASAHT